MVKLLNTGALLAPQPKLAVSAVKNKGEQIMNGLLLNQYQNSTNLKEYYMAFISEFDFLFEQIQEVYEGRFIENAVGRQLDIIGIILQQNRSVILPTVWFGFQGAVGADGMASEATPGLGGVFRSEDSKEGTITPLDDITYRRVLYAKAMAMNRDSADVNFAYYIVSTLLGRVPSTFTIQEIGNREVELVLDRSDVAVTEVTLILYMAKYFVPDGITFTIRQV